MMLEAISSAAMLEPKLAEEAAELAHYTMC